MISRLEIVNFRCHERVILDLNGTAMVVTGPNGAGKSSLLEAVQFLICGRTIHTGASGGGAEALIRDGAEVTEVGAEVLLDEEEAKRLPTKWRATGLTIQRGYRKGHGWEYAIGTETLTKEGTPRPQYRRQDVTATVFREVAAAIWGDPKAAWAALSRDLLSMSPADQQAALTEAAGLSSIPTDVFLMGLTPVQEEQARERLSWFDQADIPRPKIGKLHRAIRIERREEAAKLKGRAEAIKEPTEPEPDNQKLRTAWSAAADRAAEAAESERVADETGGRLADKLATLGDRIRDADRTIKEAQAAMAVPAPVDQTQEETEAELALQEADLKKYGADQAALQTELHALDSLPAPEAFHGCPLDQEGCEAAFETKSKDSETTRERNITRLDRELQVVRTNGERSERHVAELKKALRTITELQVSAAGYRATIKHAQAELPKLQKAAEGTQKSLTKARAAHDAAIKAEEGLREAADKLHTELQATLVIQGRWDQYRDSLVPVEDDLVEFLKELEDRLDPAGRLAEWTAARSQGLQNAIKTAAELLEPGLTVTMDPLTVLVDGRPVELLSDSEQLRAQMVLQVAMASNVGTGVVLLDRLDWLDPDGRSDFMDMVDAYEGQVIGASTSQEATQEELPDVEGLQWVWFGQGGQT